MSAIFPLLQKQILWGFLEGSVAAFRYLIKLLMTMWFIFLLISRTPSTPSHILETTKDVAISDGILANISTIILCASSWAIIHILLRTFAPGLPRGKGGCSTAIVQSLFSALEGANHPWVCFLGNRKVPHPRQELSTTSKRTMSNLGRSWRIRSLGWKVQAGSGRNGDLSR